MDKTAAVTVCLLWLLLLLAVSTSREVQGDGASSLSTFLVSPAEATENSWTTKTSMPTKRHWLGVAAVNGKIYAIGGESGPNTFGTNEMYDPATNTWVKKVSMPTAMSSFAVAVYEDKIFAIGGMTPFGAVGVTQVYDTKTDKWGWAPSMPTSRGWSSASVVDGKIYVIGGCGSVPTYDYGILNVNEVYDLKTGSWITKTPLPLPVYGQASAVVNNKIYIIGGKTYNAISNLVQIYDPETDTWSLGAPPPKIVGGAVAGATPGVMALKRIYVIGEYKTTAYHRGWIYATANQVYNPKTNTWTMGAPMPTSCYGLGGVAVVNDTLYVIGGGGGRKNERYTPFGFGTPPTEPQQSETFPITLIVAATAIIAISVAITLGVVTHRRKRLASDKTP